jgi:hypothetical protein
MSNKKMTAVEWLVDQLEKWELYSKISFQCLKEIEQAKAMEKEQIMDAFDYGLADGFDDAWHGDESIDSTQYYEETYEI